MPVDQAVTFHSHEGSFVCRNGHPRVRGSIESVHVSGVSSEINMVVFREGSEVWHHAVYSRTVQKISVQIQLEPFGIPTGIARVGENAHPVMSDCNVHIWTAAPRFETWRK